MTGPELPSAVAQALAIVRRAGASGGGRFVWCRCPSGTRAASCRCGTAITARLPGASFCIGAADGQDVLCGVVISGRPVARLFDDGLTLEVTRAATDGTRNACLLLYAAAWRAAKALGYRRLVTYTQQGETGASLRAAGWRVIARRPPHSGWDRPSRPRELRGTEGIPRTLWEAR